MDALFRRLSFRNFNYETDISPLVDMHRARAVLEGGWFDEEETCRLHARMVIRAGGRAVVGQVGTTILVYADVFPGTGGSDGLITTVRQHPDFAHPVLLRRLFEHLGGAVGSDGARWLVHLDDADDVPRFEQAGWSVDRRFWRIPVNDPSWPDDAADGAAAGLRCESGPPELEHLDTTGWLRFLGRPVPLSFAHRRGLTGYGHGLRGFRRPDSWMLTFADQTSYLALFDGREFMVFRREVAASDGERCASILTRLAGLVEGPGPLAASERLLETLGIEASGVPAAWTVSVAC